ncbi:MAG TPA: NAD(P)/FAD-dependent oxidoreductase [Nevskiaceae bacterium]
MEELGAVDVAVIGAGPAGAVAAALARRKGLSVRVLERGHFPRFQIGESLLAQCLCVLDDAGIMEALSRAGFQRKNGAQVVRSGRSTDFLFSDKYSEGFDYAFDVQRATFDQVLAQEAARQGAEVVFGQQIVGVEFVGTQVSLRSRDEAGREYRQRARFLLDASGFGRVLPRLLGLGKPSDYPVRVAVFTHVEHRIDDPAFRHDRVRITIHPDDNQVSYWLIPFSDGTASVGVVAPDAVFPRERQDADAWLWKTIREDPDMGRMLRNARQLWPARALRGYSSAVTKSCGERFALLGNAAGFLDPVFSSGVTLAVNSAKLAVDAMARELAGEQVDWQQDFVAPMALGTSTCSDLVESWYSGDLQDILLSDEKPERIYRMLCGVLGGYVWDRDNAYVGNGGRRLRAMAEMVRSRRAERAVN